MTRWLGATTRRPWATCLLAAVASAAVAAGTWAGYRSDNSLDFWIQAAGPQAAHYRALEARYGTDDYVVAAWAVDRADDPAELARAGKLADLLRARPEVSQVFSPADPSARLAIRLRLPLVVGNLVSADGKTLAVAARLDAARRPEFPALLDAIRTQAAPLAAADRPFHWGGPPIANAAITEASNESLLRVLPAVAVAAVLALVVLLRSIRAAAAALLAAGAAALWTAGAQTALGIHGNLILNIAPPLVLVLGLSLAVHVVAAMQAHGRAGRLGRASRLAAVRHVAWPGTLAAATTLIGTLSVALADSPPLVHFALVAAGGIVLAWATNFLVLPALAELLAVRPRPARRSSSRLADGLARLLARRPGAVAAAFAVVSLAALVALGRLSSANDPLGYLPPGHRLHRDYAFLESRLGGMTPFLLIVHAGDKESAPWTKLLAWTKAQPLVGRAELIDPRDGMKNEKAIVGRIESRRAGELGALSAAAAGQARPLGATVELAGTVPAILDGQSRIFHGLLRGLGGAAVLFAIIFAAVARRLGPLVTAASANAFPLLACFGAMAAVGVKLDVATAMIGSLLLGLAVDGTLHLLVRWRRRGATRGVVLAAWGGVVRPITVTAWAVAAAFAFFAVAPFRPTALFGMFLAGGLIAAWAADLLLLPAGLILVAGDKRE